MQGQALSWIADAKLDFTVLWMVVKSVLEIIIVQMVFLPRVHSTQSITLRVEHTCWTAIACMDTIGWMRPIPVSHVRCVVRTTIASTTVRMIAPTIGRWRRRARRQLLTVCVLILFITLKMIHSVSSAQLTATALMERGFSVPRTAGRSTSRARTNRRIACVARGRLRTSRACVKPAPRIISVLGTTLKMIVLTTVRPKHIRQNYSTANARLVTPTRRGPV